MTPKERVVVYMGEHPRITLRQLAAAAGIALTEVKDRSFAKLIYDLRDEQIFQTSAAGFESEFTLQPDRQSTDALEFVAPANMSEIYTDLLRSV